MGDHRVGMPARHNGLSVTKWLHPLCFAANLRVDYAPTGRASCKGDGSKIEKGEPRLLTRYFNCLDAVGAQCIFKPRNAASLLEDLRVAGAPVVPAEVDGVKELAADHRQSVIDALAGKEPQQEAAPAPLAEPTTSVKRRSVKQPRPPGKRSKSDAPRHEPVRPRSSP